MLNHSVYSPEYQTLRKWLKKQREEAGHSIRSLADILGTSHQVINKVEMGRRKLDVLEYLSICSALGCDPNEGLQLVQRKHRL